MTDEKRIEDDELLSAWLDGELSQTETERVGERLAHDAAFAARLEQLRGSDARLRSAYGHVADEPLPTRLVEMLSATRGADERDNVVELRPRSRAVAQRVSAAPATAAIAAGIALVVGVLVGYLVGAGGTGASPALVAGVVARDTALHKVLQNVPSSETRELEAGLAATPVLTFRTRGGDYCRELRIGNADGTTAALACRREDRWQLEVTSFTPRSSAAEGAYRPAAGESTAVSAAVDEMIAGGPLGAEAERALIAEQWSAE